MMSIIVGVGDTMMVVKSDECVRNIVMMEEMMMVKVQRW